MNFFVFPIRIRIRIHIYKEYHIFNIMQPKMYQPKPFALSVKLKSVLKSDASQTQIENQ